MIAALLCGWGAAYCQSPSELDQGPLERNAQLDFFERKIRPVLVEHCYRCHSQQAADDDQLKAGLLVDSRQGLLHGGDSGTALIPGDPGGSLLIEALRYESFEMPPEGRLPDQTIADFETWIRQGAADPREAAAAPVAPRAVDIQAGREHWAYAPLTLPPEPPASTQAAASPIDAFILTRLQAAKLDPLPLADRRTLARRLYFDLTGLPPSPEQIDDCVDDRSPYAYQRLVDQLLASPAFGQRWGRHWLDVARYAESVTLRGLVQHQAWRYRDYVIEAFNSDLPYDQFLMQQIAGDLLPADSLLQQRRNCVATTFLTLSNANLEDQDKEKLRMDVVDEQLTVIGAALLGQTIGCARCHDHKFDPIPTTDYYALAGILRNTRTLEHANVSRWIERPLPLPEAQQRRLQQHDQQVAAVKKEIAALEKSLGEKPRQARAIAADTLPGVVVDDRQAELVGTWKVSESVRPYIDQGYSHDLNEDRGRKSATFRTLLPAPGTYEVRLAYTSGSNRSSIVRIAVTAADGQHPITINQKDPGLIEGLFVSLGQFRFTADDAAVVHVSNRDANGHVVVDAVQFLPVDQLAHAASEHDSRSGVDDDKAIAAGRRHLRGLQQRLKQLERDAPKRPLYMGVEDEAEIADMQVNIRGSVHNLGATVPRGFLQVVSYRTVPYEMPVDQSGRLQLGQWLADPSNPLPARVMANRIWHWLFGAGLVRTPDNFGRSGELPTHPQLLDYLAGCLVQDDWSVKAVVRQIVLSDAYRRSSGSGPAQAAVDPDNRLLWRMQPRRLEAECLLDAVLAVSGRLDLQHGGKTLPDNLSADYGFRYTSPRRAVYWPVLRNAMPDLLQVFDGADPSLVTGKRNVSSVAPQSLYLMNNPWLIEHSEHAARRLLSQTQANDEQRLQLAFRRTLGRLPTEPERAASVGFLDASAADTADSDPAERLRRWTQLMQALFCTLDFRYLH